MPGVARLPQGLFLQHGKLIYAGQGFARHDQRMTVRFMGAASGSTTGCSFETRTRTASVAQKGHVHPAAELAGL